MTKTEDFINYIKSLSTDNFEYGACREKFGSSASPFLATLARLEYIDVVKKGIYVRNPKIREQSISEIHEAFKRSTRDSRNSYEPTEPEEQIIEVNAVELLLQLEAEETMEVFRGAFAKTRAEYEIVLGHVNDARFKIDKLENENASLRNEILELKKENIGLREEINRRGAYERTKVIERVIKIKSNSSSQSGSSGGFAPKHSSRMHRKPHTNHPPKTVVVHKRK